MIVNKPKKKKTISRYTVLYIIMAVIFTSLFSKLLYLQVYKYDDYKEKADTSSTKFISESAPRGIIYDSDGNILATSEQTYVLTYMQTTESANAIFSTLDKVFKVLSENGENFEDDLLLKVNSNGQFYFAFKNDNTVLIEEFIKGKEYRFLVIDDEVVGILHRVPANVIGDGEKTISELVEIKNQDPLRGKGYVTPLEKIRLEENAELFLKQQGKNFDYIPKKDEIVYLRENSNISTGGDSIDFTDIIPNRFKEIAIKSAKAIGAKICGVDMVIEDYTDERSNYGIIELNFNPAIHIHSYPYEGKERNVAKDILNLLGFKESKCD